MDSSAKAGGVALSAAALGGFAAWLYQGCPAPMPGEVQVTIGGLAIYVWHVGGDWLERYLAARSTAPASTPAVSSEPAQPAQE